MGMPHVWAYPIEVFCQFYRSFAKCSDTIFSFVQGFGKVCM